MWNGTEWVLGTPVTSTETQTRAMTEDELKSCAGGQPSDKVEAPKTPEAPKSPTTPTGAPRTGDDDLPWGIVFVAGAVIAVVGRKFVK